MVKLTESQLNEKLEWFDNYIAGKQVENDVNSNQVKNLVCMDVDINKDITSQIKTALIKRKIKELYGEELSNQFSKDVESHLIYQHDSTKIAPYCVSVSLYTYLWNGTKHTNKQSKFSAPQHLKSFCGSFINLIQDISAEFVGAVATVEFLMYFDYFARKDYGDNYLIDNKEEIISELEGVIYSMNQDLRAGSQSIFWNVSIFDEYYFDGIFHDFVFPKEISDEYKDKPSYKSLFELQKVFMQLMNQERTRSLLTFPVVTASMLTEEFTDEDGTIKKRPKDKEFARFISKQHSEGDSFFIFMDDNPSALSSCCRLKSDIDENEFSYSLGAGGLQTGSIMVLTINLNRLVQLNKDNYLQALEELVNRMHKYHRAFREIIKDLISKGMLMSYDAGFINIDKQYSTIGINGLLESAEFLGIENAGKYDEEYINYCNSIVGKIKEINTKARKEYGFRFNTEMVPGESLGYKNYEWDKADGLWVPESRVLYNSYLYAVEDEEISIVDKFYLYGAINSHLDGGSALHLNLSAYFSEEQFMKILELAATSGCLYFCINVKVTICHNKDCGYINKNTETKCVKCGCTDVGYGTRVIGYLKEISSFSNQRQIEAEHRFYHKI